MIKLPVQNLPKQNFTINIEESLYEVLINYNSRGSYYTISITLNEKTIIVKLVAGIFLFKAFNNFNGDFIVINSANYNQDPILGSWDNSCELFYFTKDEVNLAK